MNLVDWLEGLPPADVLMTSDDLNPVPTDPMAGVHINCTGDPMPGDDERICCYGAVMYGACNCWRPVHDREQLPEVPDMKPVERKSPCASCACRPIRIIGVVEVAKPPMATPSREPLEQYLEARMGMVGAMMGRYPFFCHTGMRRRTGMSHPDGAVVDLPFMHDTPNSRHGWPLKADGTPADICSGFAGLVRRAYLIEEQDSKAAS